MIAQSACKILLFLYLRDDYFLVYLDLNPHLNFLHGLQLLLGNKLTTFVISCCLLFHVPVVIAVDLVINYA